jgi:AcrR family transcriptional regulator
MAAGEGSGKRTKLLDGAAPGLPAAGEVSGRREQILQAAQKLFADQGFRETNLNDVATQLGFRRQAVYHYFATKEEILYELINRAGQAVEASAKPTFDSDLPPVEKLAEIVRNHARQILTNVDIFRIQFSELSKLSGNRADMLRRDMSTYVRRIANVIEAGQKDGTFIDGPPMIQALLIIGMGNGTTDWYSSTRSRRSIDEIADYAARIALSGLLGSDRPKRSPSGARR